MRRFIALFLIALLPLQVAWGMAASACLPGVADAPQRTEVESHCHEAHHSQHVADTVNAQTQADAPEQAEVVKSGKHGSTSCQHGACCGPLAQAPTLERAAPSGEFVLLPDLEDISSPTLARPERPKWCHLA